MRPDFLSRLQALEKVMIVRAPVIIRYGWVVERLPDYLEGPKHFAIVSEEADQSGCFRWCEWVERAGPAPA